MPWDFETIIGGGEPCLGLYDKREGRYAPPRSLIRAKNVYYDAGTIRRRDGYERCHDESLLGSSLCFDGVASFGCVSHGAEFNVGTTWGIEAVVEFPDALPLVDQSIVFKGSSTANEKLWDVWFDATTKTFKARTEHATESKILESAVVTAKSLQTVSLFRDGTALKFLRNGVSEDTDAFSANTASANPTGCLLFGARANNAAGNVADGQFSIARFGEVRFWTADRSDANVLSTHAAELPTSDVANLRHLWRFRETVDRNIIRDSADHITLANRRNGYTKPGCHAQVDFKYPENVADFDQTNRGIDRGEAWKRFDGIAGLDEIDVTDGSESVFSEQTDSKYQWCFAFEFLVEDNVLGNVQTVVDWESLSATNPNLRIEVESNLVVTATSRWGGTNNTAATIAFLTLDTPYVAEVKRDGDSLHLTVYKKSDGTILETIETTGHGTATGELPAGNKMRRGASTVGSGTNFLQGSVGSYAGYKRCEGEPMIQDGPPVARTGDAVMVMKTVPRGTVYTDALTGKNIENCYTPTDPDGNDGPCPSPNVSGFRQIAFAHFQGLQEYKRQGQGSNLSDLQREVLVEFGGVIYRSPHASAEKCLWKKIHEGRTGGRTNLTTWARYEDSLVALNGTDPNILYDGSRATLLGVREPLTAPSLATGTNGNLFEGGTYTYFIVFYDPEQDQESNPGPEASHTIAVAGADKRIDLTNIPVATDPTRSGLWRRIYRSKVGVNLIASDLEYRVGEIENNHDTTFTDNLADLSIAVSTRIDRAEFGFYANGIAPKCRWGTTHEGRLWLAGDPENPTTVYFSRADKPQAFPAIYTLNLSDYGTGEPITALWSSSDRLFAFTEKNIWEIIPTDNLFTFSQRPIVPNVGAAGQWGVVDVHGALFFMNPGDQRIYFFNGQGQPTDVSDSIDQTFFTMDQRTAKFSSGVFWKKRDLLIWLYSDEAFDDTQAGYEKYPDNNKALVLHIPSQAWSVWDVDCNVLAILQDPDTGEDRLFGGDYTGWVRKYDVGETDGFNSDYAGDVHGTVTTGGVNSIVFHGSGNWVADELIGLKVITIGDNGLEQEGVIIANTTTAATFRADFPSNVSAGTEWWLAGIDFDVQTPHLDSGQNVHNKKCAGWTVFHSVEAGYLQGGTTNSRMDVFMYQDGSTTSVPAKQTVQQHLAKISMSPHARLECFELGLTHSLRVRAKYPKEPCEVQGWTIQWKDTRILAEAQ